MVRRWKHGESRVVRETGSQPGRSGRRKFLLGSLPIVQEEPATITWYGIKLVPRHSAFSTRSERAGRQAHLSGKVAAALMAKAPELFAKPPAIEKVDVLAAKLPR